MYLTYYVRDASGNIMATYPRNMSLTYQQVEVKTTQDYLKLDELSIYGSNRLGIARYRQTAQSNDLSHELLNHGYISVIGELVDPIIYIKSEIRARTLDFKRYELSNHLGNVMAVIEDSRYHETTGSKQYFMPMVVSWTDYSPFGFTLSERSKITSNDKYRYAYNGKEKDDEWSGSGNMYDYGFRIYDPRVSRFLSIDPLFKTYPWYTPYQYAGNSPIAFIDLDGLERVLAITFNGDVNYRSGLLELVMTMKFLPLF